MRKRIEQTMLEKTFYVCRKDKKLQGFEKLYSNDVVYVCV